MTPDSLSRARRQTRLGAEKQVGMLAGVHATHRFAGLERSAPSQAASWEREPPMSETRIQPSRGPWALGITMASPTGEVVGKESSQWTGTPCQRPAASQWGRWLRMQMAKYSVQSSSSLLARFISTGTVAPLPCTLHNPHRSHILLEVDRAKPRKLGRPVWRDSNKPAEEPAE